MKILKEWLPELLLDTVVAAIITLIFHIVESNSTWGDAASTFAVAFLVMFAVGVRQKRKKKD